MDKEIKQQVYVEVEQNVKDKEKKSITNTQTKYKEEMVILQDLLINLNKLKEIYETQTSNEIENTKEITKQESPIYTTADVCSQGENIIKYIKLPQIILWYNYINQWLQTKKQLAEKYGIKLKNSKDKEIVKILDKLKKQEQRTQEIVSKLKTTIQQGITELNNEFNSK